MSEMDDHLTERQKAMKHAIRLMQQANLDRIAHEIPLYSDGYLKEAYQRTDGEPGNPEADALLAEIERRNLDV